MKYQKVLISYLLYFFFHSYCANDSSAPFDMPQSPLLTPARAALGVANDELMHEGAHHRKNQAQSRMNQRRGSVLPPLQPIINTAGSADADTPRPSANTIFDFAQNGNRPSSASIRANTRLSAVTPSSAVTTPTGHLLPTPLGKKVINKYPSPPDHRISLGNPHTNISADFGNFKVEEDDEENKKNNNNKARSQENNSQSGANTDSEISDTNIQDNNSNKSIYYIVAAVIISFSILYKTNKKFYSKVNYYWEKIKSKIKLLYNNETDSKPKNDQSRKVTLGCNQLETDLKV